MKKTIKLIILAVFVLTLIFSQKSFAWQQGNLQDNKTTITVQSSYLGSSESTIAVALKSSNKFGENSNVLTKENLKNLIKEKYGKDIVSKIYKTDGTTEIADNEYVGTGYKVELLTNKKLTVILYGDVNSDGQINTNDTVAIAKYNVGANKLNEYQKKAAKLTNTGNYDISTNDSVRVAYYNVNGLGTNKAGKNIVDVTLYPADEKLSHNSQLKVLNVNNAEEEYKTALNTYTDGKFTANNSELKLENGKLTGTVKYNFEVGTELFPENELTGYYFAYVLKVAGANENTTVKIKNGSKVEKTILYESFDVTTAGKEGIVILTSLDKNENNKNVEIEIDLDGEGTLYAPVKQKINYEGLTFEDISQAAITMQIPEEDVEGLKGEVWNYRFEFKQEGIENQGYSIEKTEKNKYKATGIITEQKEVTGFSGDDKTDYYVVFAVEPTYVYDNIQIKIPRGNSYITVGKEALTDGKLTAIISVKEDNKSNPIKVLVDLDGSGNRFQEEEITIDYSKLELRKASTFNLENGKDYQKLKDAYGWKEPSEDYTATFTADTEKEDTVKVSGVIPYLSNWENGKESPFSGESKTGYYLALVINTDVNKKEETTVKIIDEYNNGTETKTEIATILGTSFDEESKLYVLKHLHLDDTSKTFTIEVDMDGEGKEYNPYTITVDWSELVLQQDSKAEINLDNASNKNKQEMSDWGYKTPDGQKVELTSENSTIYVSGKLIEQELTDVPFGEKSKDGYYFDFTISHPKGMKVNPENVKIKRVTEPKTNGEVKKEFTELDENNNLTILYRFDPETTSCTACKEKEKCDDTCCGTTDGKCDKQAYYVVDWDGEGKEFLPVVYTLDFCKLTFEKSSIFTVEALQESDKGEFGTDDGGAWYDTEHGYSVKVTQDEHDTTKYKVTGVLPIFDDTQDEEYNENFDTDNKNLYYLGLVLKLVNAPSSYIEGTGKMTVKFYHNEGTEDDQFVKAMGGDFDSSKELYILKALTGTGQDGEAIPDKEKVFTITIDLDGDDSEEFAPYTVTIDWSGLKLQDTSRGDFGNYDVIEKGDLTEESPEQKELNGYGFDYDADAEVSIKTETQEETQHESKKGLEGTIKE